MHAPVGVLNDDLRAACLAALKISPQACLEFAARHTWEASARAFVDNIADIRERRSGKRTRANSPRSIRVSSPDLGCKCLARLSGSAIQTAVMATLPRSCPSRPADIDAAARVLAPFAVRTPLLSSPALDERVGTKDFPEAGNAAADRIVQVSRRLQQAVVDPAGRARAGRGGVLLRQPRPGCRGGGADAGHAGDHRDARRCAAVKRERTKAYGAEVVLYDRDREDREAIARDIAGKRGATLVPPYDDPKIIAGQGTVGREIAEDMAALGITPDIVVAPASGGGLIAGIATAVKARFPQADA